MENVLSDEIAYYIETKFDSQTVCVIYEAFGVLRSFNINYAEDKYRNLISREDTITSDDKADNFILGLENDLREVIKFHSITLTDEHLPIYLLNEICQALYLISNLEDYRYVLHVLSADTTYKEKIVALFTNYSLLTELTLRTIIHDVGKGLIQAIENLAYEHSDKYETEAINKKYLNKVNQFFSFTKDEQSLGKLLFDKGYINLTFDELCQLTTIDIHSYLDEVYTKSPAKAALDLLSLLMISTDYIDMPLFGYEKMSDLLFTDQNKILTVKNIMVVMLSDFRDYLAEHE